jgi:hypothetical protein
MNACRDCIHIHIPDGRDTHFARCHHPKAFVEIPDVYNGKTVTIAMGIITMRGLGPCGPDGTLFAAAKE